jgi:hypothetical protein
MSDNEDNKKSGFTQFLEWANEFDNSSDSQRKLSTVVAAAPTRIQAYAILAATATTSRLQALLNIQSRVDDRLLSPEIFNNLSPHQLLSLRGHLEKDIGLCVSRLLPQDKEGQVNPVQILNLINGQSSGSSVPSEPPRSTLNAEQRDRVRSFVRQLVSEPESQKINTAPVIKVVGGNNGK